MAGKHGRDRRPYVKKPTLVDLPENVSRLRVALFVVLLLIGIGALVYSGFQLFTADDGWQRIQSNTNNGETCAAEFVFNYQLGRSGVGASVEARRLTARYT